MCDFAPRQNFDIDAAIMQANIVTAGLFRPSRFVFAPASAALAPQAEGSAPASAPLPPSPDAGAAARTEREG